MAYDPANSESLYAWMRVGSLRSALAVVPFLMELLDPRSVVDAGCGTGSWLKVFQEHGVEDVLGFDGEAVPRSLLEIGEEQFRVADVLDEPRLGRRFDLALCLELAHYLPAESAARLVENLTTLAPAVLLSAGFPGQGDGGPDYGINQQWPEYWAEHFEGRGYVCVDCVRPRIWDNPDVQTWYVQNLLVFADRALLDSRPALADEYERARGRPLAIVHPRVLRANQMRLARARAELESGGRKTKDPP
jgi:SAM-dependent methyltransferase